MWVAARLKQGYVSPETPTPADLMRVRHYDGPKHEEGVGRACGATRKHTLEARTLHCGSWV